MRFASLRDGFAPDSGLLTPSRYTAQPFLLATSVATARKALDDSGRSVGGLLCPGDTGLGEMLWLGWPKLGPAATTWRARVNAREMPSTPHVRCAPASRE